MSVTFQPFDDEQLRALINIQQLYDGWIAAARDRFGLAYNLKWKTVKRRDYLYEVIDRAGNAKSLGPRSEETERAYSEYRLRKEGALSRLAQIEPKLRTTAAICRALKLPMLSSKVARTLREMDRMGLMGGRFIVIDENCLSAYMVEAAGRIVGLESEAGNEVELVAAQSPKPEWQLRGKFVDRVLVARDGSVARVVAPDPRWFALHKLWLSDQPQREPSKNVKDRQLGEDILNIVVTAMPHFPLDDDFWASVPEELNLHRALWT